jgi:hypothetical protein
MSDYERQHDLDDELLSAYLDDELSPEERAAVEARLATDPTAQQLVHQLRAVSEAVQALPQEVVGHDMRDSILHKANEARQSIANAGLRTADERPEASNGQAVTALEDAPKFTLGRTRRGWVWASLAIAAALLIMVFGREPERDDLAAVAKREDRADSARRGAGVPEIRAVNEPAAASDADPDSARPPAAGFTWQAPTTDLDGVPAPSTDLAASEPASGARQRGRARDIALSSESQPPAAPAQSADENRRNYGAYSDRATATEAKDEALADKVAEMSAPADQLAAADSRADLHYIAPGTDFGVAAAGGEPAAAPAEESQAAVDDPLVIVRVHARRTALESKTFDRLLERSGIEVEPDATNESVTANFAESRRAASRFAQNGQTDGAAEATTDQPAEAATVDAVLVEAPPAAIVACMTELSQDQQNFLGVAVDDTATGKTESAEGAATDPQVAVKQKLAKDLELAQYNRGSVPTEQESLARDRYHFFRSFGANFGGGRRGGASADEIRHEVLQQGRRLRARKTLTESEKGLAVRLKKRGNETPAPEQLQSLAQQSAQAGRANENASTESAATLRMQDMNREMREAEQAAADNKLQVLFLFSLEEPGAATPTPASRGKAQ